MALAGCEKFGASRMSYPLRLLMIISKRWCKWAHAPSTSLGIKGVEHAPPKGDASAFRYDFGDVADFKSDLQMINTFRRLI